MMATDFEDERDSVVALDGVAENATEPTAACKDFATSVFSVAHARAVPGANPMTIDSTLIWALAKIVASIVIACAPAAVAKGVDRVGNRPNGLLARKFRARIEDGMVKAGAPILLARGLSSSTVAAAVSKKNEATDWEALCASFRD